MNFEKRPWGNYTVLQSEATFQVKKLVVNPGKRISLQSHKFRAEHWFIVSGHGTVELDGKELEVGPGDSIDVPIGSKHRIYCSGAELLVFIEVQTGSSFAEDDIVRYEDDFGRIQSN
jgi:mannose-6-phosphate isomerase-like protein (cupin superfamily)